MTMTILRGFIPLISLILLVFACVLGEELPAPCHYIAGQFNFNCTPTEPTLYLAPGKGGSVEVTCCFTGDAWNNTNQARVLINQRDEWFYKIQQPDGSFKSMIEMYPATAYITNIQAPGQSRGFQPFTVKMDFQVPQSTTLDANGIRARVDIAMDIMPEPIPSNAIVVVIKEKKESLPNAIVNTVGNIIGGLTGGGNKGGGGSGGLFLPNLFQPKNETKNPEPGAGQPAPSPAQKEEPEEQQQLPRTQKEQTGPQLPNIELKVPDLTTNYALIGAGIVSLILIALIVIVVKP